MPDTQVRRPTTAYIDLDNLAFNLRQVREFVGRDVTYLAVVKANAYGHGAVECSRRLADEGVSWLGVALPEEGIELRNGGIKEPILVLGGFWPGQEGQILEYKLTPVLCTARHAALLDAAAARAGIIADYHVKIDTGMGRIGVRAVDAAELARDLLPYSNIRLDGLMTHFAAADDLSEMDFTYEQIRRFDAAAEDFLRAGFTPRHFDLANSPGAVAYPRSRRKMVRLGGVLYGLGEDVLPSGIDKPELRPVMSLMSTISYIKKLSEGETVGYGRDFRAEKDSVIAAVPVGYADGYPRSMSKSGHVIVNGHYVPVAGRISMDWTTIDITDLPDCQEGDEVVLIGEAGGCGITAADLARTCGTISYEITCGINPRVLREFIQDKSGALRSNSVK
jgi:alanine racemase